MMMMMIMMIMMMKIIIAVTQSIFKLGPQDFTFFYITSGTRNIQPEKFAPINRTTAKISVFCLALNSSKLNQVTVTSLHVFKIH